MRTEDDLRAAFGSQERQAPDITSVLAGTRAGAIRAQRRRLRVRAGGALAAVVVAAAAAITLTQAPAARDSQATAATGLRAKLLAAFDSAANEILYLRYHAVGATAQGWYYPWGAQPGQRVRFRMLSSFGTTPSQDEDMEFSYTQPTSATTKLINVAATIDVNYAHRTWSERSGGRAAIPVMNPAAIRAEIASGKWTASGPVAFDGHRAIELTGQNKIQGRVVAWFRWWVDARTYLPLRTVAHMSDGGTIETDYKALPATPANLALLKPVIPPGFTRS